MKLAVLAILGILVVFLGVEVWYFSTQIRVRSGTATELRAELESVLDDRAELEADRDYYSDDENLEKELRGRFNYRAPGESMIILVPERGRATNTTSIP